MRTKHDNLFLLPVQGQYLLYAPLHGVRAWINEAAARALQAALETSSPLPDESPLKALWERLTTTPRFLPTSPVGAFAPTQLSFLVTNDCNLRCSYCGPEAGKKTRATVSEEIADAACSFFAEIVERDRLPNYTIYLHGGEPFLAGARVEYIVAQGRKQADRLGVPFGAAAATNGVMSASQAEWVARHFNEVMVSLDGPAAVQNKLRPAFDRTGSFDRVAATLNTFDQEGLAYHLRCTVTSQTVGQLPEIARFFCETFHPKAISFEPLAEQGRCLRSGLTAPDADSFVRGVIAAHHILKEYGVELKLRTADVDRIASSNCGVAEDRLVVMPDGRVTTCFGTDHPEANHAEMFQIGRYDPVQKRLVMDEASIQKNRTYGVEFLEHCRSCFCKWHCAGGCRMIHTPPEAREPFKPLCEITQQLTLWNLIQQTPPATPLATKGARNAKKMNPEEKMLCA